MTEPTAFAEESYAAVFNATKGQTAEAGTAVLLNLAEQAKDTVIIDAPAPPPTLPMGEASAAAATAAHMVDLSASSSSFEDEATGDGEAFMGFKR